MTNCFLIIKDDENKLEAVNLIIFPNSKRIGNIMVR